jgi:Uma2 family endonuclease
MVSARQHRVFTLEEYLAVERGASAKSEFVDGAIYAMTGGSLNHAYLGGRAVVALSTALRGRPCRVFNSELQVFIPEKNIATYPDVTVVCGAAEFWKKRDDLVVNPSVVVEVLSPSTEAYDRGEKAAAYRTLVSLMDYVLVSQDRPAVEVFSRKGDAWEHRVFEGLAAQAVLVTLEQPFSLGDLYDGVTWDA